MAEQRPCFDRDVIFGGRRVSPEESDAKFPHRMIMPVAGEKSNAGG
jgi:hypothetical protein